MTDYQEERPPGPQSEPIFCNGLYWEPQACRSLLSYDKSLERVRKAGYERHPRCPEVMQVLKAGLEGKLTGDEELLFQNLMYHSPIQKEHLTTEPKRDIKDILANPSPAAVHQVKLNELGISPGEWVSEAIERTWGLSLYHLIGHKIAIIIYRDPEGLVYKHPNYQDYRKTGPKGKYLQKNFTCREQCRLDLIDIWITSSLRAYRPSFVKYMYGSTSDDLPIEMLRVWPQMSETKTWLPKKDGPQPFTYHTYTCIDSKTGEIDYSRIWIQPEDFAFSRGVSTTKPSL